MADGINKTNNTVVAPDIGNMVMAFVQNETVQKVASFYMDAIESHRGLMEKMEIRPSYHRSIISISKRLSFNESMFKLNKSKVAKAAAIFNEVLESNKREVAKAFEGHAAIGEVEIMDRHAAVKGYRMLYHRGFEPTGKEKVKVLIGGLINMFARLSD